MVNDKEHQPSLAKNHSVTAYKFRHQLVQKKGNRLHYLKNADCHPQWMLKEDWGKPVHPIQLRLHQAMLMQ